MDNEGSPPAGFPNLFMVLGPNGPFTNLPPSIETQVDWIAGLIQESERRRPAVIEATDAAEQGWTDTCRKIADLTLFPKAESWIFGANTPGRANTVMFYLAGLGAYRQQLDAVAASDYLGFNRQISGHRVS